MRFATGSLLTVWWKMRSLGPRLQKPVDFGLWLARLPVPPRREGPVCSLLALFRYLFNPMFCECARSHHVVPFTGYLSLSFFPFFSLVIPWFGLLSHITTVILSSGHSDPVLTLRTDDAATPPCPAPACWWWTQVSGILLCSELH